MRNAIMIAHSDILEMSFISLDEFIRFNISEV